MADRTTICTTSMMIEARQTRPIRRPEQQRSPIRRHPRRNILTPHMTGPIAHRHVEGPIGNEAARERERPDEADLAVVPDVDIPLTIGNRGLASNELTGVNEVDVAAIITST